MRIAPGPSAPFGLPLPTWPGFFGGDRMNAHVQNAERYGDVVRLTFGKLVAHTLRNPDHVRYVLNENHTNYRKGRGIQKMKFFLGEGLLTSEGDYWRRQRRLAQPAFHRQRLAKLASTMAELTAEVAESWKQHAASGKAIDVHREVMALTLNIAARTLFGADVRHEAERLAPAITVALEETNRRTHSLVELPMNWPLPRNIRYREAAAELDRVVYGMIAKRRKSGDDVGDLLSMLILAKDEETGEAMSDLQVRDEVMTLFLAGHETTANALSWTFYLLSKHPAEERKMNEEHRRVLGGRDARFEDLAELKYTRMVFEESMRLYPPAWIFGRTALEDDEIGGYHIPKGSLVGMSPWVIHRHTGHWSNPEGFDPERFTPEASANRHKYAYIPFAGGPRVCIGNSFAIMEAQIVLAGLLQHYRLELVPGARVIAQPVVTLRPKTGVPMTVHTRAAVSR